MSRKNREKSEKRYIYKIEEVKEVCNNALLIYDVALLHASSTLESLDFNIGPEKQEPSPLILKKHSLYTRLTGL